MKKIIAATATCLLVQTAAHGATLNIAADGTLMGASGVDVLGTLYDVTFADGLYYFGITAFTDERSALAASSALMGQVFLGDYDTLAKETNGCTRKSTGVPTVLQPYCAVLTPYYANIVTSTFSGAAVNWTGQTYARPGAITVDHVGVNMSTTGGDVSGPGSGTITDPFNGTFGIAFETLARWSPHVADAVAPVPEPQTWALMLVGLGVIGGAAACRRKAASDEAAAV